MNTIDPNSSGKKDLSAGEKIFKFLASKSLEEICEMIGKKVSFGSLRLTGDRFDGTLKPGYYHLHLDLPGGYNKFSLGQIRNAAHRSMRKLGLEEGEHYLVENKPYTVSVCLTRKGVGKFPRLDLSPQGKFDYRREILQISLYPGGGAPLRFFASTPEGVDIAFLAANELGLKTDPNPYIDYGKYPLEKLVEAAEVYEDEKTGRRYASLVYFPNLANSNDCWADAKVKKEYKDWSKKILVFAGIYSDHFGAVLNNREVVFKPVSQPNKWMIKARGEIRSMIEKKIEEMEKREERCDFNGLRGECGNAAEFDFYEPTSLKWEVDGALRTKGEKRVLCGCHKDILLDQAKKRLTGSMLEERIEVRHFYPRADEERKELESW